MSETREEWVRRVTAGIDCFEEERAQAFICEALAAREAEALAAVDAVLEYSCPYDHHDVDGSWCWFCHGRGGRHDVGCEWIALRAAREKLA